MILKTLEEIKKHKQSIESKSLFTAIIYFLSPITGEVEERHMYADDNAECVSWLQETCNFYRSKNIKHYGYNNGAKLYGYLNPFELIM